LSISLPPLRDRREDIGRIAERYLAGLRTEHVRPHLSFSADALWALEAYDWPGNIRELENIVLKAFADRPYGSIEPVHLRNLLDSEPVHSRGRLADEVPLHQALQDFEADLIRMAVARHPTLSAAARALGIDLRTLYAKRLKHSLG
jgi:transcriptional regulator with PAS, ATPase and Fis domain